MSAFFERMKEKLEIRTPLVEPSEAKVSTEFSGHVGAMLKSFAESLEYKMELRSMNKTQRRSVYFMALRIGDFKSVTIGKDETDRRVTVYKYGNYHSPNGIEYEKDVQLMTVSDSQWDRILKFLHNFPLTKDQICLNLFPDREIDRKNVESTPADAMWIPSSGIPTPKVMGARRHLPVFEHRTEILNAIKGNSVTIVTGGTGCGKTTQVPQFVLEDANERQQRVRLICTQPRRLSAIAIAERVAFERDYPVGGEVGYHVRLERKTSKETILTYCTSGVLLRMLTADDAARNISHIFLDEIHERELETDYLLIAVREALRARSDLKVVLMSATLEGNFGMLTRYFADFDVAVVDVPSRVFNVEKFYLGEVLAMTNYKPTRKSTAGFGKWMSDHSDHGDAAGQEEGDERSDEVWGRQEKVDIGIDIEAARACAAALLPEGVGETVSATVVRELPKSFDASCTEILPLISPSPASLEKLYTQGNFIEVDVEQIVKLVMYILDSSIDGSMLVFLPGYDDIQAVRTVLEEGLRSAGHKLRASIFVLHSQMQSSDQQLVFDPVQSGFRKVILSTNIAEASLTIEDVVFVIDCGQVKQKRYYHASGVSQLKVVSISKSNAEQRSGRAGRCRNGYCFRLYTRTDYEHMAPFQEAEINRVAIHEVCLHAKMFAPLGMTAKEFLAMAPEPPKAEVVKSSLVFLEKIGALCSDMPSRSKLWMSETRGHYEVVATAPSVEDCDEGNLTELGKIFAQLPLTPDLSRMLLMGVALKCFRPVVTLVAMLAYRDPFSIPSNSDDRRKAAAARQQFGIEGFSDHLMMIRAFNAYEETPRNDRPYFCRENFLMFTAMKMIEGIRRQLVMELSRVRMFPKGSQGIDDVELNRFSGSWPMIQAAIVAGSYPCIGCVREGNRLKKIRVGKDCAMLHPGGVIKSQVSALTSSRGRNSSILNITYIAFQELVQITEGICLKNASLVSPLTVALFGGDIRLKTSIIEQFALDEKLERYNCEEVMEDSCLAELGQSLVFKGKFKDLQVILQLRCKVMAFFWRFIMNRTRGEKTEDSRLLDLLNDILSEENRRYGFPSVNLQGAADETPMSAKNDYDWRQSKETTTKKIPFVRTFTKSVRSANEGPSRGQRRGRSRALE